MNLLAALRALPFVAAITLVSPARADSLEIHIAADVGVPAEEIEAAIAAELGAELVDQGGDLGALELRLDAAKRLAISHRRSDGTQLVRIVSLPALPADRIALIAYVTGNLVRDQLADLAASTPPVAPAAVTSSAPATSNAAAPAAPTAPVARPTTVALPPPVVAPSATTIPAEQAEVTIPLSIGLVPPLSTDRFWTSRARVRGAINVIAGASASVDGISVSGVADLSANVRGLQIGGAVTLARDTVGVQIGGAGTIARRLRGGQIAGATAYAEDTVGVQIAGAGAVARDVHGVQIAGAASVGRTVHGLQIAGAANVAGQLDGAQIGPINVARRARGLQLGVINISDESDGAQIGVLNFVRRGRTDIDAWAESTGLAALALRHGGRYVHNIYAIGFTPDGGDTPLVGLGLGFHHNLGGTTLDLDAMAWQTHMFADGVGLLAQARATLAIPLGPVDGFVAAAYNVSVEDRDDVRPLRTAFARTIDEPMSSVDVALWPSLAVGVRGHLGPLR